MAERPRAFKDLLQLSDDGFLAQVARGLQLLLEHVNALCGSYQQAATNENHRAAKIVQTFLDEEAAKFLILVNAVRCDPADHIVPSAHIT